MKSNYSFSSPKKELATSFTSVLSLVILLFVLLFSSSSHAQLAVNCTGTQVTCYGAANGTASVNVSSGTPPYTYHWTNGATTSSIANLVPGSYSVFVTDNLQDSAFCSFVVTQLTPLLLNDSLSNPTC